MRSGHTQHGARIPQHNLIELVGEFHRELDVLERTIPAIDVAPGKGGDLLMQEILRATEGHILDLDFLSVIHFRGIKSKK